MPNLVTFTLTCPQRGHANHYDKRCTRTEGRPVLRASIVYLILGNVDPGSIVGKGCAVCQAIFNIITRR